MPRSETGQQLRTLTIQGPVLFPTPHIAWPVAYPQALVPGLDSAVLSLALGENGWDVDRAVVMLRRFQVAKGHELRALEKV